MQLDDLDPGYYFRIKALADARFEGDKEAALKTVLATGLDNLAVPNEQTVEPDSGSMERVHYTAENDKNASALFIRSFPGRGDELITFGSIGVEKFDRQTFLDELETICRYDDVNRDRASFVFADNEGQWFGWGLLDFGSTLCHCQQRYESVDRNPPGSEKMVVGFRVGAFLVVLHGAYEPVKDVVNLVSLDIYGTGEPLDNRNTLATITGHFGGSLGSIEPFDKGHHETRMAHPIEPIEFIESPRDPTFYDRAIVPLPSSLGIRPPSLPSSMMPNRGVVNFSHHVSKESAEDHRYQILRVRVVDLGAKVNIELRGQWYENRQRKPRRSSPSWSTLSKIFE